MSNLHISHFPREPRRFWKRKPGSWAWSRFQYSPLHCLKCPRNSVTTWLAPTSFCKEYWLLQNDSLNKKRPFTKWHGSLGKIPDGAFRFLIKLKLRRRHCPLHTRKTTKEKQKAKDFLQHQPINKHHMSARFKNLINEKQAAVVTP